MKKHAHLRSLPHAATAAAGAFEPPLRPTVLALLVSACFTAHANPTLPQVVNGQATFNQQGNLFSIVNTPNTIINWQSFSIGQGELTRFIQQNANSSVLNRITGQDPSQILGALQSNGKVFLINPNGVLFGRDARIDVNGLVASSLGMTNQDFLAGKMNFNAGDKAGAVINQGTITSGAGGQVLLIAPNVDNSGIITAPNGDVMLAAGHSVQLADASNPSLQVVLSAPGDQAINVGQVIAQGGKIGMVGALLNQRGVLNANSAVVGDNGKIVLKASGKVLLEAGSLTTATGAAGNGGVITVTGDQVGVLGNARVDASGATGGGSVLLGGDYQGKNAAVSNARQVFVDTDASISADAVQRGDGGKVIVWGSETARVFGNISARGGAASGDGGLVETSGHYLDVKGIRVDTSSRRGKRGNWLLDPYDIDVVAGYGGELGSVGEFLGGMLTGTTSIGADTISSAESNVTLQATHRINFNSAINMANPGVGLTAMAGETINVNADITTSGGAVTLSANDATGGMAYGLGSDLKLGATINTNGGTAYLSGASVTGAGTVNTGIGGGDLTLRANNSDGGISLSGNAGGNQLTGATLQLQADNISYGRGIRGNSVTLTPMTFGRAITLGVVGGKPADSLALTNAELFQVVADTLTVGGSGAGTINQTGSLSISDSIANLELRSGVGINLNSFFTVLHNLKLNVGGDGGGDNLITSINPLNVSGEFFLESGNWVQNSASLPSFSAHSFKIGRANFLRATGGDGSTASPYRIADVYGLQGVDKQVYNTNYILAGDIDASGTASWNQGAGFAPLFGSDELAYSGVFDGANHAISGLFINSSVNNSYSGSGLFARLQGGTIRNLTMQGGSVTGGNNVGALVGNNSEGTLSNVTSSMAVSGTSNAGGLVGANGGTISNASASGNVTGRANVEGGMGSFVVVGNDGDVSGSAIGGLVGSNNSGASITVARATGAVTASGDKIGGLVGNNDGAIDQAYATGGVGGGANIGGLVGRNGGSISNAYATGAVGASINSDVTLSHENIGGLIGRSESGSSARYIYSSGAVANNGFSRAGAVVGRADGGAVVGFSYFNYQTSGIEADGGGSSGRTTAQMQQQAQFGGYNFGEGAVWRIYEGNTTPMLKAFLKPLQVTASGAASRVYDGQLAAFTGTLAYSGLLDGDSAASGSAGYDAARNVGSYALGGLWSTKYDITLSGATTLSIMPRALSVAIGGSKVYDGQLGFGNATLTLGNTVAGDTPGVTGTAQFVDKNAGAAKAVNVSGLALSGNELGNYTLVSTASGTAAISRASLGLASVSAANKVYDGTTAATISASVEGVIGADQVQLSGASASFSDKNAGAGKTVAYSVGGANLQGVDAGNYTLANTSGSATAAIATRTLNLAFSGVNKVYDGLSGASVTIGDDRIAGDVLSASASAAFGDKNAGLAKTVTVQNASLAGVDAANYKVASSSGSATANIAARALTVAFSGVNKVYDGTSGASVAAGLDDRISGDVLTAAAANATFADKNAGDGKTVSIGGIALSGADAGNYTTASNASASANISRRTLDLSYTGVNKVYDGSTVAVVTVGDNRISGDVLSASASGVFGDKNAGAGKAVAVQNASVSGTDANNYALASTSGATTAAITPRALGLSYTGVNKTYDGTTAAVVSITDNRIANDVLTASANAAFGDKNAGTSKTVTVQNAVLSGTDAGNYTLASNSGATTANISARTLDLSYTGINKTYDATTAAAVTVSDNRIVGDVLTTAASATFIDKNAGAGKAVTVQNAVLSGLDAGNYTLSSNNGATTATIGAKTLDLGYTGVNKIYDGSTAAAVSITDNRIAGDVLTASATSAFGDKNAGAGKTVTVQNAVLSGADAGNYTLASSSGATTATIGAKTLNLNYSGVNKVYDGSTVAAVTVTDNRIAGDVLTAGATSAFVDKNAGAGKTVTVQNAVLSGADAGNYTLASNSGATTATITPKTLDLSYAGVNKTYDGSTATTVSITDNRIANDVLTASASATFGDKNAGVGKAVTVQNAVLSGVDGGNYKVASTTGATTAAITPRALDLSYVGVNKTYDGSAAAAVTVTDNRIAGDVLTASATSAFADKNAGTAKTVTVQNASLSGLDAGNYSLASSAGSTSADITPRVLSLSFTGVNKIYDGATAAAIRIGDDRIAGDVLAASASAVFGDKNAATGKTVSVQNISLAGKDAGNYSLASSAGSTSASILPRTLNLSFFGVEKMYDGTNKAEVTINDDRVAGDALNLSASAIFSSKDVAYGKAVKVDDVKMTGGDASNYTLASTGGFAGGTITERPLALSFSGLGKVYDATPTAAVNVNDNRLAGDQLNFSYIAFFTDKNVADGKTINVFSIAVYGQDAMNYSFTPLSNTSPAKTSANITARPLTLSFSGVNKIYDGNTTAGLVVTDNRISEDKLTASASAVFDNKNAGTRKVVTVENAVLSGQDAGNYTLASNKGATTASITPKTLDLSYTGINKTYDGSAAAAVSITDNRIANDVLTTTASATFFDKNAGVAKPVKVENAVLSGQDAGNYTLASNKGETTATITPKTLDLSYTGVNKTYDGSAAANVSITDNRIANDVLTATASAAFADKNAGTAKTVAVQNAALSGTDAGNYTLASNKGETTATITPKTLDLSYTGVNKTYDGSVAANVSITDNRIANDVLTAIAIAAFADKNAGAGKTVAVQNVALSGTDAGNYTLASNKGETTATITPKTLDLSYTGVNKVYDGSTAAAVTIGDNRIAGDVLSASASATFADKNAGVAKAVNVQNAALSGVDAGNYTLASNKGAATADIAQRALNLSYFGVNKVYDGSTAAALTIGDDRVAGDALTAAASATFVNKNAGAAKAVTVQNASLSGLDAGNYSIVSNTGATTADIAQRLLNVTFNGINKVYDGGTAATVTVGRDDRIAGDTLSVAASAAFADKNAGSAKTVTISNASLSGLDAANYALVSTTGSVLGDIQARPLSVSFNGTSKVYDGTTQASYSLFDSRLLGDTFTLSATATYADKNVGSNKTISVRNIALSGPDAGNYSLGTTSSSTSASITQRALTLGFTGADKVYDGGVAASIAISDNRIAGDVLTATASAVFADKNAGAGKAVTVGGIAVAGQDAGNYRLASDSGATTASIAQRALNLGYTSLGKVYDGATGALVSISDDRILGDVLSASANAAFVDKNVGVNKTVTVQNASVSGLDAGNYRLASNSGTTSASIAQRALNVSYSASDKVYDATTGATVSLADNRVAGDALALVASASFGDKNAGAAKAVTLGGVALSGADAGNYRVVLPGATVTAAITPAALVLSSVSAADKTYDGTLATSVSGAVSGVIGRDVVGLTGGNGTFADSNYGSGKLVTIAGFGLSGADAGNYRLTSNGGQAQASIAQRALSTWIGGSSALWSDAANWEGGVIPVGANVLAADFGNNTGNVVYNAAAGATVLKNLTSRGGLSVSGGSLTLGDTVADSSSASGVNLSGGALQVGGNLTTANYAQSGGVFSGLGNLTVSNSFSQSAGAIISGGNLAINQASGDLRFAALTAKSISLSAGAGAISQSGAIVADSLSTQSQSGTVLTGAGNRVKAFSATNSGAGGIALLNTTAPNQLLLGSLTTGSGNIAIENTGGIESHAINANSGNVSLVAHSPVSVQGAISGGDISVEASTEVAFGDGARINAARNLAVKAGTDVTLDGAAALKAGNNIALTATNNLIMRGSSSLEVPATGSMTLVAQTGSISAATGVLIDSHGGPVSLTATKGTITAPSSIFVGATLASAIIGNAPAVAPTLASAATNYANSVNQQYSPLNAITPQSGQSPLALQLASNQTEKSDGKKEDVKKTFCN